MKTSTGFKILKTLSYARVFILTALLFSFLIALSIKNPSSEIIQALQNVLLFRFFGTSNHVITLNTFAYIIGSLILPLTLSVLGFIFINNRRYKRTLITLSLHLFFAYGSSSFDTVFLLGQVLLLLLNKGLYKDFYIKDSPMFDFQKLFYRKENALGTTETVLILAGLVSIALIFKGQLITFTRTTVAHIFEAPGDVLMVQDPYTNPKPTAKSVATHFSSGTLNSASMALSGAWTKTTHPEQTFAAILHPVKTTTATWHAASTALESNFIQADASTRSKFVGSTYGNFALAAFGTGETAANHNTL